jgi:flavin reductase (DIM6/NTAB) family NADH-FMN oxidoreductase RutF
MEPKRYMVAVYHGTKTLEIINENPRFLLQLLSEEQYPLVRLLGQQTGHKVDKISRLQKRGLVETYNGYFHLKEALSIIELEIINKISGGDHDVFICELVSYRNLNAGEPLTTSYLRHKKIIRA